MERPSIFYDTERTHRPSSSSFSLKRHESLSYTKETYSSLQGETYAGIDSYTKKYIIPCFYHHGNWLLHTKKVSTEPGHTCQIEYLFPCSRIHFRQTL